MEALRRIFVFFSLLVPSVLASAGLIKLWSLAADYEVYNLWDSVARVWLWVGGVACLFAFLALLVGAFASLFFPAKETFPFFK